MLFNIMENLNFSLIRVINIGDGVAQIDGLSGCMSEELIFLCFFNLIHYFFFNLMPQIDISTYSSTAH